jgi:hypothetical protein
MTKRTDDLLSYFDRLIAAERSEYHCQREIGEVIAELRDELNIAEKKVSGDETDYIRFKLAVKELSGSHDLLERNEQRQLLLTNKTLFQAYKEFRGDKTELFFGRCSGVTTTLQALAKTFDDVYVVTHHPHGFGKKGIRPTELRGRALKDSVLFVDSGANFCESIDLAVDVCTVIKCHSVDSLHYYETKDNGAFPYKQPSIT